MNDLAAKSGALPAGEMIDAKAVEQLLRRCRAESADEASAYFLHAMMLAIGTLAGGNKLVAGRAYDDAITSFLADIQAEMGIELAQSLAGLLIRNIALFLAPQKRDMVQAALDT